MSGLGPGGVWTGTRGISGYLNIPDNCFVHFFWPKCLLCGRLMNRFSAPVELPQM